MKDVLGHEIMLGDYVICIPTLEPNNKDYLIAKVLKITAQRIAIDYADDYGTNYYANRTPKPKMIANFIKVDPIWAKQHYNESLNAINNRHKRGRRI